MRVFSHNFIGKKSKKSEFLYIVRSTLKSWLLNIISTLALKCTFLGQNRLKIYNQFVDEKINVNVSYNCYKPLVFTVVFSFLKDFLQALQILKQCFKPRYSTTDHWIQESIKRISNSGLFWAVGAAEKKNSKLPFTNMQLLRSFFYVFMVKKTF